MRLYECQREKAVHGARRADRHGGPQAANMGVGNVQCFEGREDKLSEESPCLRYKWGMNVYTYLGVDDRLLSLLVITTRSAGGWGQMFVKQI